MDSKEKQIIFGDEEDEGENEDEVKNLQEVVALLKQMVILEREKRKIERKRTKDFVSTVLGMKKVHERRIQECKNQLKDHSFDKRKPMSANYRKKIRKNVRSMAIPKIGLFESEKVKELEKAIEEKDILINSLHNQHRLKKKEIESLKEEINNHLIVQQDLHERTGVLNRKLEESKTEIQQLRKEIEKEKEKMETFVQEKTINDEKNEDLIQELQKRLDAKNSAVLTKTTYIQKLLDEMMSMKNELSEIRMSIMEKPVKKIGRYNRKEDYTLMIIKNPKTGSFHLDLCAVDGKKKHYIIPFVSIVKVSIKKETNDRFIILHNGKEVEELESFERGELVQRINEIKNH